MEYGWDFSGLVREAPFCIVGLSDFFSHLYKSHTIFLCVWYGSSATSWDRYGFIEGSIGTVNFRGRLGLCSIRSTQSLRWEEIEGSKPCSHAYQRKMAQVFKKRVKLRPLQRGDLVLRVIIGLIRDPRGKFKPSWSEPYFIKELTLVGIAWLMDLDGN